MKRRAKVVVSLLMVVIVVIAAILILRPEDRRLTSRGKKVASTVGWYTKAERATHWLNDTTLLAVRNVPERNSAEEMIEGPSGLIPAIEPAGGANLFTFDIRAQRETPLVGPTAEFCRTRGDPRALEVSPAGSLRWESTTIGRFLGEELGQPHTVFGTRNTGGPATKWVAEPGLGSFWLADGLRWMEIVATESPQRTSHILVFSFDHPSRPQRIPAQTTLPPNGPNGDWYLDLVTSADRLIFSWDTMAPIQSKIDFFEYKLGDKLEPVRTATVRFPRGAQLLNHKVSPDGSRVAWLFRQFREPAFPRILSRLRPYLGIEGKMADSLWVSAFDGSGMHEVGYLPATKAGQTPEIEDLQWLPGGKQISFRYRDVVWTISPD